jgi:transcriptional regulator with XRE-family HTH domain
LVNAAQRNFGRRLRDQRERSQIALSEIAEATKLKRSVLEELERGDVSGWPGGIFRRAFVRAYASAIGLPPEPVVEEFTQVFPDGAPRGGAEAPHELRLTLVVDPWRRGMTAVTNVAVALVEAGAIVALALLTAWLAAADVWSVSAVLALTYYAVSAACLGRSPGSWCLEHGLPTRRPSRSTDGSASARARDLIHLVQRREPPDEQTPEDGAPSATPLRAASH